MSSEIISFLIKKVDMCYKQRTYSQGRNKGGKGGTDPLAPSHYGGAKSLRVAEKSQQCHKHFLQ